MNIELDQREKLRREYEEAIRMKLGEVHFNGQWISLSYARQRLKYLDAIATRQEHPTNEEWTMYDPLVAPPPTGCDLLLINEGGVLIKGHWYDGALAWAYKPKIPQSVKDRMNMRHEN